MNKFKHLTRHENLISWKSRWRKLEISRRIVISITLQISVSVCLKIKIQNYAATHTKSIAAR